jgi:hypothetical protein
MFFFYDYYNSYFFFYCYLFLFCPFPFSLVVYNIYVGVLVSSMKIRERIKLIFIS